jgi:hypothetical protein
MCGRQSWGRAGLAARSYWLSSFGNSLGILEGRKKETMAGMGVMDQFVGSSHCPKERKRWDMARGNAQFLATQDNAP